MSAQLAALQAEAENLQQWMLNSAMPLWAGPGMHASGAAWEALDFTGQPVVDDRVRVRVQARQLYVFALALRCDWQPARARQLIEGLWPVLSSGCQRADGLYGKSYSLEQATLLDDTFCLYDTAFVLLALAKVRTVLDTATVDAQISQVLSALDTVAAHPDGGFYEELPALGSRLQNPHMHLFESLLALRDAGYGCDVDQRLNTLFEFISSTFFDQDLGLVRERQPDSAEPMTFEPGHSLEWTWLLTWYANYDVAQREPFAQALYRRAVDSLDEAGRACMVADINGGKPDASCRLWSQAEALKAHVCMALAGGEMAELALPAALTCAKDLMQHWLAPAHEGGWHDHFAADQSLAAANMPASTGYHLFGAIMELRDTLNRIEARS